LPNKHADRLISLEIGRGVAALLVAAFHISGMAAKYFGAFPADFAFRGGHAGVEYFFVLSGFIIFYVHHQDLGWPDQLRAFAIKRALRIVPMYWVVLTPIIVAFLLRSEWGVEKDLTSWHIAMDFFLVPRDGVLVLPPAWTLEREFLFYSVYALMIVRVAAGLALFAVWQCATAVYVLGKFIIHGDIGYFDEFVFGVNNLGFLLGVLICSLFLYRRHWVAPFERAFIAIGACGFAAMMFAEWYIDVHAAVGSAVDNLKGALPYDQEVARSVAYSLAAGSLILGAALWEVRRKPAATTAAVYGGGASYLVYLLHMPMASVLLKLIRHVDARTHDLIGPAAALAIIMLAVFGAALVLHVWLERPVTRFLRRRLVA
jgi:exopolysaccharide production protein ExoZ